MRKSIITILTVLATVPGSAQEEVNSGNGQDSLEPTGLGPIGEVMLPILFIAFLIVILITLIKYFLDYRLKNKLIDKGMANQLSSYLSENNDQNRKNDAAKMAILFCGIGLGLLLTHFSSPVDIHSLAIMAMSLGLSYLAYFFYLRK